MCWVGNSNTQLKCHFTCINFNSHYSFYAFVCCIQLIFLNYWNIFALLLQFIYSKFTFIMRTCCDIFQCLLYIVFILLESILNVILVHIKSNYCFSLTISFTTSIKFYCGYYDMHILNTHLELVLEWQKHIVNEKWTISIMHWKYSSSYNCACMHVKKGMNAIVLAKHNNVVIIFVDGENLC